MVVFVGREHFLALALLVLCPECGDVVEWSGVGESEIFLCQNSKCGFLF